MAKQIVIPRCSRTLLAIFGQSLTDRLVRTKMLLESFGFVHRTQNEDAVFHIGIDSSPDLVSAVLPLFVKVDQENGKT